MLTISGIADKHNAILPPKLHPNHDRNKTPKTPPTFNREPSHEASSTLMAPAFNGEVWFDCNIINAGDNHPKPQPLANTPIFASNWIYKHFQILDEFWEYYNK